MENPKTEEKPSFNPKNAWKKAINSVIASIRLSKDNGDLLNGLKDVIEHPTKDPSLQAQIQVAVDERLKQLKTTDADELFQSINTEETITGLKNIVSSLDALATKLQEEIKKGAEGDNVDINRERNGNVSQQQEIVNIEKIIKKINEIITSLENNTTYNPGVRLAATLATGLGGVIGLASQFGFGAASFVAEVTVRGLSMMNVGAPYETIDRMINPIKDKFSSMFNTVARVATANLQESTKTEEQQKIVDTLTQISDFLKDTKKPIGGKRKGKSSRRHRRTSRRVRRNRRRTSRR